MNKKLKQLDLLDLNAKAIIGFTLTMILAVLMYIAFFK
jgi:hypothetical protein